MSLSTGISSSNNDRHTSLSRRNMYLFLVIAATALATSTSPATAADSPPPQQQQQAGVDSDEHHAGVNIPTSIAGHRFDSGSDDQIDEENDDVQLMDVAGRLSTLLGVKYGDDDSDQGIEKRKMKMAAFRSDLGKRISGDAIDGEEYAEKRAYRQRGGKAFKADLGKRGRNGPMFRSDLGKRSNPSFDLFPRQAAMDGGRGVDVQSSLSAAVLPEFATEPEMDSHEVERRRSMFRSDLGKRSTKAESVRRMFRADLGKRVRAPFRHDLG